MKPINISAPVVYKDTFKFNTTEQIKTADELFEMVDEYNIESALEEGGKSTADLFNILEPDNHFPHNLEVNAKYVVWLRQKMEYLRTCLLYTSPSPRDS